VGRATIRRSKPYDSSITLHVDAAAKARLNLPMPFVWILLLSLCLLPGCSSSSKSPKDAPPVATKKSKAAKPNKRPVPPKFAPANPIAGRIALVNPTLRYVVVDFSLGRRPVAGQQLNIYRQGQKVGEIRISSQAQENNFAADIVSGDVRTGDEAREE